MTNIIITSVLCSGHNSGEARSSFSELNRLSSNDVSGISSDGVGSVTTHTLKHKPSKVMALQATNYTVVIMRH